MAFLEESFGQTLRKFITASACFALVFAGTLAAADDRLLMQGIEQQIPQELPGIGSGSSHLRNMLRDQAVIPHGGSVGTFYQDLVNDGRGTFDGSLGLGNTPTIPPPQAIPTTQAGQIARTFLNDFVPDDLTDRAYDTLREAIPPDQLDALTSPEALRNEARRRGLIDDTGTFMIFNGDDIGGYEGFIGPSNGGLSAPTGTFIGTAPTPRVLPDPLVRAQIWYATGVMHTLDPGLLSFARSGDAITFTDLGQMSDKGLGLPLCDTGIAQEPLFGSCSGVLVQDGDALGFLTAKHCLGVLQNSPHPSYAFFDYDGTQIVAGTRAFTSRRFGQLDPERVRAHPVFDIAMIGIDWESGAPPAPARLATPDRPIVGQRVGSIGYPLGRPRKQIFGERVVVDWVKTNGFGAFVDSFAVSSGSPVFDFDGSVLGVLSNQPDITDFALKTRADGTECTAQAVVSSLKYDPPLIVKAGSLD